MNASVGGGNSSFITNFAKNFGYGISYVNLQITQIVSSEFGEKTTKTSRSMSLIVNRFKMTPEVQKRICFDRFDTDKWT